jgi:hypothetical protein
VAPQALRTAADRCIVGQHAYVAITDGHVEEPIRTKQHTAPEGAAAARGPAGRFPRLGDKDVAHVGKARAVEAATRHGQRHAAIAVLRIREIDQVVRGEVRVQRDVVQAADEIGVHRGRSRDRCGIEDTIADEAQAAGTFGDEDGPPVRQERHAPGMGEAAGERHDAQPALRVRDNDHRVIRRQ